MKGGNTDIGLPQFGPYSGEHMAGMFGGVGTGKGGGGLAPTYGAPQIQGQKVITGYQDVEQPMTDPQINVLGREMTYSEAQKAGVPMEGFADFKPQTQMASEPIYGWQDLPQVAPDQPQYSNAPINYGGK